MKRGIISALLVAISCTSAYSINLNDLPKEIQPKIKPYVLPEDEIVDAYVEYVDDNKDGTDDVEMITINSRNIEKKSVKLVQVTHGYKKGKLLEHPYSHIELIEKYDKETGKLIRTLTTRYDWKDSKSSAEMPRKVVDFKPDGIFDSNRLSQLPPRKLELKLFQIFPKTPLPKTQQAYNPKSSSQS